jgi:hypothetical protein
MIINTIIKINNLIIIKIVIKNWDYNRTKHFKNRKKKKGRNKYNHNKNNIDNLK